MGFNLGDFILGVIVGGIGVVVLEFHILGTGLRALSNTPEYQRLAREYEQKQSKYAAYYSRRY